MSYTKALYYPTIDIEDDEWIKNAILFWDEIDTIVPKSISNPYKNANSLYLSDLGILKPISPDYKRLRKDELRRFRSALGRLTEQKNFTDVESIDELKEVVHTIYENDFLPALTAVKETMADRGITFIENLSSYVTTFFTPSLFLNSINEFSCAIGTGACLVHWGASERLRVRNIKRSNPYSYLLSLRNDGKVMFR